MIISYKKIFFQKVKQTVISSMTFFLKYLKIFNSDILEAMFKTDGEVVT